MVEMCRLLLLIMAWTFGCTPLVAEVFHVSGGGRIPVSEGARVESTSDIIGVPNGLTLIPEGSSLLVPQLKTADGTVLDGVPFTFVSSDPSIVAVVNGELKALKPGTVRIEISAGGVTEVIEVTVVDVTLSDTEPDIAAVTQNVTLSALADSFQLQALTANTTGTVQWVSLDSQIALVTADGVITSVKEGTVSVQAILLENGIEIKRVTIAVTVRQEVSVIRVEPSPAVINSTGESLQLTARAYDANNHPINRSLTLRWQSGNSGRVTVNADGIVTALPGSVATTTQIVVTAEGKSSGTDVSVGTGATVQIDQGPKTLTSFGEQTTFTATVGHSTGTVVWSLSNASVSGAPASGPTTTVTAQANGVVTLTATLLEGVDVLATDTVTVTVQQTVATLDLTPVNTNLTAPGDTQQLTATARDGNNNAIAGVAFSWNSSNALLPVDADGLVTAQGGSFNESTTVRASVGAIQSNAATVSVGNAPTVAINCVGAFPVPSLGDTRTCTATITNGAGTVVWALENQTIANHDPGLGAHTAVATKLDSGNDTTLTAVHDGSVTLKATFLGISDSITLDVAQAVGSIDILPTLVTLTRQYDGGQTEAQNQAVGAMGLFAATARDANGNTVERTLLFDWNEATGDVTAEEAVDTRIGKAKASAVVALNLVRTVTATTEGVTSTDDGDDSGNVVLNYASGNVPVVVIIP